jgi:transcription elongation GreA/GreB family factor
MGIIGGSIGGKQRARNLTAERRTEIARLGGLARQALAREAREERAGKTRRTTL